MLVGLPGEFFALAMQLVQLRPQRLELAAPLQQTLLILLAHGQGRGDLALQGADLVAENGQRPHLVHLSGATLLVFAPGLIESSDDLGEAAFAFGQGSSGLAVMLLGRLDRLGRLAQLVLEIAGPHVHLGQLATVPGDFLFEFRVSYPLMLDGRLVGGDALAVGRDVVFRLADLLVNLAGAGFGLQQAGFDGFGFGARRVALGGQARQFGLAFRQPIAETAPIDQAHVGAQFQQAVACSCIDGLAGL